MYQVELKELHPQVKISRDLLWDMSIGKISKTEYILLQGIVFMRYGTYLKEIILSKEKEKLSKLCDVSINTVNNVMGSLVKKGYLYRKGRGRYQLNFNYVYLITTKDSCVKSNVSRASE